MVELFANNAHGLFNAPITAGDLSLTLQAGQGALFPNPTGGDFFRTSLIRADLTAREVVFCTARSGDVLTIQRGKEGTTPATFSALDRVRHRPTAGMLDLVFSTPNLEKRIRQIGHVSDGVSFISDWGMSGVSTGGTASRSGVSNASQQASIPGVVHTATTTLQVCGYGICATQGRLWRGNAANCGGFDLWIRFAVPGDASGAHAYFGLDTNTSATYSGGSPDTRTTVGQIGIGWSNAAAPGTNFRLFHNDGGGGPVGSIDTGIARDQISAFAVRYYAPPNASFVEVEFYNLRTGQVFLQTVTSGMGLPSNGVHLNARHSAIGAIGVAIKLLGAHKFNVNQGEPVIL